MAKKIKVYSTPTCPYCEILKEFLKNEGIEFESIDLSQSKEDQQYILEKTGKLAVPVTEIDGQFVVGFDKEKIKELL
jgi:glutaredoxin 3